MNRFRKTLSMFLVIAMVFSLLPVSAFAADEAGDEATVVQEQEQTAPVEEQEPQEPTQTDPAQTEPTAADEPTDEPEAAQEPEETQEPETAKDNSILLYGTGSEQYIPDWDEDEMYSDDELFAMYATGKLYGQDYGVSMANEAYESLDDVDLSLYYYLKAYINMWADGELSSTEVTLDQETLNKRNCIISVSWTTPAESNDDLNDAVTTKKAEELFAEQGTYSVGNIVDALLYDAPYEMYWYDKTKGTFSNYGYTIGGYIEDGTAYLTATVTKISFKFTVAKDYSASSTIGGFELNTELTSAASNAAVTAQNLVAENCSLSDYEKMVKYKEYICDNVSYNYDAVSGNYESVNGYGDPWQIIYVFDGDDTTNVVCEGYAKAFQYLCDLSDLNCYLVSGKMDGGGHMWNVVRLDGENYLVDVTNSDDGTVGQSGGLFLAGTTGSITAGYTFLGYLYMYDDVTTKLYGTDDNSILNLASSDYDPDGTNTEPPQRVPEADSVVASSEFGSGLTWIVYSSGKLSIVGTGAIPSLIDGQPWADYRDQITSVVVGQGITEIGSSAFSDLTEVKKITIGDDVTTIGDSVFTGCISLTDITIPSGVTSIGTANFVRTTALTNIAVADDNPSYKSVDGMLLTKDGTTLLSCPSGYSGSVAIPSGVTQILPYAFNWCTNIESVTIPASLGEINANSFQYCTGVKSYTVDSGSRNYKSVDGVVYSKDGTTLVLAPAALTSFTVPEGVTVIDNGAFEESAISQITLPDSLQSIGAAFMMCSNLKSVTIPENVTELYNATFGFCENLEEVHFTGDAPTMGDYVFNGTGDVQAVTVYYPAGNSTWTADKLQNYGGNVTWVAEEAATSGSCGENMTWELGEDGVLTISGNGAMSNEIPWKKIKSQIKSVKIVSDGYANDSPYYLGITEISSNAFANCVNLESVTIDSYALEKIGNNAFSNCTSLKEITIPDQYFSDSLEFGDLVFSGCTALTDIYFECNAPAFGENVFQNVTANVHYKNDSSWTEDKLQDYGGNITWILSGTEIIASGTTGDLSWTLSKAGKLVISGEGTPAAGVICDGYVREVVVGSGVTAIGDENFKDFSSLTSVVLPDSVTSLGSSAFEGCSMLGTIELPANLETIGESAFAGCTALTSIEIPAGVSSIGGSAFSGCEGLAYITFTGAAPTIGTDAFENVTAIAYYPSTKRGWTAAARQSYGGNITWRADDENSGNCGENLSWTFEDGVLTISGTGAMDDYSSAGNGANAAAPWHDRIEDIKSIVIGDGVTGIGSYAFCDCYYATSVSIGKDVTTIGDYAFAYCNSLEELHLPDGVTTIGNFAFLRNIALKTIELGSSLTSIGTRAFAYCDNFSTIAFPATLVCIGGLAFYGCSSITDIYFTGDIPYSITSFRGDEYFPVWTITGHYPGNNATWTEEARNEFDKESGATVIVWIADIDEAISGTDDSVSWTLDASGNLTITGTGEVDRTGGWSQHKNNIVNVTIGSGITSIGEAAFSYCTNIERISLPDTLTSIGEYAFYNCSSLKTVVIPDAVTEIKSYTFDACTSLTSIIIPDSITAIDAYAFSCCTALNNVVIPDSVTSLGEGAFYRCFSLTDITIGSNVTSLGALLFYSCDKLQTLNIPASVTSLGDKTFYGCSSLTDVYFTGNAPTFGEDVFGGDENSNFVSATVHYPKYNSTWSSVIDQDYSGTITWDAEVAVVDYGTCGDELTWILDEDGVLTVSGTGAMTDFGSTAYAQWDCYSQDVTKVVINDGVTTIGNNAFLNFKNLTEVSISSTVEYIGNAAFYETGLTELVLPEGVIGIGESAFDTCRSLTSVTLPGTLKNIGDYAFIRTSIESINIPAKVQTIGTGAFTMCTSLKEITVDANNTAFKVQNDLLLTKNGATLLACPGALEGSLVIPSGVKTITTNSLYYCKELTSISIPASVTSIETGAIWYCFSLTNISVDSANTAYKAENGFLLTKDGTTLLAFANGTQGAVTIPEGVVTIKEEALAGSPNISSLTISDGVESIELCAFLNCSSLKSVTIPASVTSIGMNVFANCDALTEIHFLGDAPDFDGDIAYTDVTAYYPNGNATWTDEVFNSLGENITWVAEGLGIYVNDVLAGTETVEITGDGANLECKLLPDETSTDVMWSTSSRAIAYVSEYDGTYHVYTRHPGTVTLTATTLDGKYSASVDIRVNNSRAFALTVTTEEELREQIASASTTSTTYIMTDQAITLTDSLVIPERVCVSVGADLIVPSGLSLTVNGSVNIYDGTINIQSGANLIVNTYIGLTGGKLEVNGNSTFNGSLYCSLNYYDSLSDAMSDNVRDKLTSVEYAAYSDDTAAGIASAAARGATRIYTVEDLTLDANLTIPDSVSFEVANGRLTVPEGVKLTANEIKLYSNTTLTVNGNLAAERVFVSDGAAFQPEDIIVYKETVDGGYYAYLELKPVEKIELFDQWDNERTGTTVITEINYQPQYQLQAVTYPGNSNGTVAWQTSDSSIATVDETGLVTFYRSGNVTITATATDGSNVSAAVDFEVNCNISTEEQLRTELAYTSSYVTLFKEVTVTEDLVIPASATLNLVNGGKITLTNGAKITVNGSLGLCADSTLVAENGTTLDGSGYMYLDGGYFDVDDGCTISIRRIGIMLGTKNEPTYETADDAISEAGRSKVNDVQYNVTSDDDSASLNSALERGANLFVVFSGEDVVIDSDLEFPDSVRFHVYGGSTLTVASGAKLKISDLDLAKGSTLNVQGRIRGSAYVFTGATVTPANTVSRKTNYNGYYIAYFDPDKATSVTVTDDNGESVTNKTITLDMNVVDSYQLGAVAEPADDASQVFTWKSSNASIATVDSNGLVKFLKPGNVTITAVATDGSNKSARVTFSVYYKYAVSSFTAKLADTSLYYETSIKNGLQVNDRVAMSVFGTDKTNALEATDFTYTSSNEKVATVDKNGVITGVGAGTATITAKLTDDPSNRNVSLSVRVIATQIASVSLEPATSDESFEQNADGSYTLKVEKIPRTENAKTFEIKAIALDAKGDIIEVNKGSFTWTSSASGIASVRENTDGTATITVNSNTDGAVVITATAKDYNKAQSTMSVSVIDYTPRLEANSLTIDTQKSGEASLSLVESYGNKIQSVKLETYSNSSRSYVEDTRFKVSYDNDVLTVESTELLSNQSFKGQLIVETDLNGRPGTYTLTLNLNVRNSVPKVTVKQTESFNLFYLNSTAGITVTLTDVDASDIEDITFKDNTALTGSYNKDTGVLTVSYKDEFKENPTGTPNGRGTLVITVNGYAYDIEKSITVNTVNTKPSLKLTSASGIMNTSLGESVLYTSVYDNTNKTDLDLTNVTATDINNSVAKAAVSGNQIEITSETNKPGRVNINVQDKNWLSAITLYYSVSVNTSNPTVRLAKSTLTMNMAYGVAEDSTTLTLSQSNLDISKLTAEITAANPKNEQYKYINVELVDGVLTATITNPDIKAGNYSYYLVPTYSGTNGDTQLSRISFTVRVVNSVPTGRLNSSSVTLNNLFSETETSFTVIPSDSDVKVVDVVTEINAREGTTAYENAEKIAFTYDKDGLVKVSFKDPEDVPPTGSYSFKVTATVDNGQGKATMRALNMTVRVVNTQPGVTLSTNTLSLNRVTDLAGKESASLTLSTNTAGYTVVGCTVEPADTNQNTLAQAKKISVTSEGNKITAILDGKDIANNGTYRFKVTPIAKDNITEQEVNLTAVTISVRVYTSANYSASVSASGSLNVLSRGTGITYTLNRLNNVVGEAVGVELIGTNADMFDLGQLTANANGQLTAELKLKDDEQYDTRTNYSVQLQYTLDSGVTVNSPIMSVRVTQPGISVTATPTTQTVYQSQNTDRVITYKLTLSSPVGAKIADNIAVSVPKELESAVEYVTAEADEDGTATVTVKLKDPSKLTANRNYTIQLTVAPADQAVNMNAATRVNLTLRAMK